MNTDIKIGVLGGDLRQLVMAMEMAENGFEVAVFGFNDHNGNFGSVTKCLAVEDAIRGAEIIVLPLPYSLDNIRLNTPLEKCDVKLLDLFKKMYTGQIVVGGRLNDKITELAKNVGVKLYDYYNCEELSILNAIPTAEGAIAIAMNELPITIHESNSVVLGYGRIGKVLARTLQALGATVTVTARKYEDFAWIRAYGYKPLHIRDLYKISKESDVIFNTIPDLVLNKTILAEIKKDTLIIDIASKPGGVDLKVAKELGLNVIWALSLPGKVAPVTSGKIIKESIINIMQLEGVITLL